MRKGFTLVELLIVITIIAIIAGMSMAALMGAAEQGRIARSKAQVAKIDQLINEKWTSYRFRQLPVRISADTRPPFAARIRLDVMRELQRLELPDRMTDVFDAPVSPLPAVQDPILVGQGQVVPPQTLPATTRAYRRYFLTTNYTSNSSYEGAECLYAIIAQIRDGDKRALEFFMNSEIGDVDQDGAYEILDPWGQPIMFLRWAPGYLNATANDLPPGTLSPPAPQPTVVVSTFQRPDGTTKPDTFDPLKVDPRMSDNSYGFRPFQLRPLIFSGGPDKVYDIYTDDATTALRYSQTGTVAPFVANDPYHVVVSAGSNVWIGSPADYDNDGLQHGDNITNHGLELEGE